MPLRMSIENETALPDGGPISYTLSGKRGMDIGRDQYLDWVLPDPTRVVSGKHCEIRYRDGGYWLTDVSTNGTFVNSSEQRVQGAHRLQNGDRVEIGRYIISVAIEGEENNGHDAAVQHVASLDPAAVWQVGGDVAPPVNPRDLRAPKDDVRHMDVLDWASDIPQLAPESFVSPEPAYVPPVPQPTPMPARPMTPVNPSAWDVDAPTPAPARPAPQAEPEPQPEPRMPQAAAADWIAPDTAAAPHPAPAENAVAVDTPAEAFAQPEPTPAPAPGPEKSVPPPIPVMQEKPRPPRPATTQDAGSLIARFAAAAGIPEENIATRDPAVLMEQLGALVKITAENLQQLQSARAQSKGIMRSSNQTMIQATDNNPLRFSPSPADALKIMFGPKTSGYLDANRSIEQSFTDLKKHQMTTFTAMQDALQELFAEFDPKNVSTATGDKGSGSLFGSKKAKNWDIFVTRWEAKVGKHDRGMLDVFMQLFAQAYDRR